MCLVASQTSVRANYDIIFSVAAKQVSFDYQFARTHKTCYSFRTNWTSEAEANQVSHMVSTPGLPET